MTQTVSIPMGAVVSEAAFKTTATWLKNGVIQTWPTGITYSQDANQVIHLAGAPAGDAANLWELIYADTAGDYWRKPKDAPQYPRDQPAASFVIPLGTAALADPVTDLDIHLYLDGSEQTGANAPTIVEITGGHYQVQTALVAAGSYRVTWSPDGGWVWHEVNWERAAAPAAPDFTFWGSVWQSVHQTIGTAETVTAITTEGATIVYADCQHHGRTHLQVTERQGLGGQIVSAMAHRFYIPRTTNFVEPKPGWHLTRDSTGETLVIANGGVSSEPCGVEVLAT